MESGNESEEIEMVFWSDLSEQNSLEKIFECSCQNKVNEYVDRDGQATFNEKHKFIKKKEYPQYILNQIKNESYNKKSQTFKNWRKIG